MNNKIFGPGFIVFETGYGQNTSGGYEFQPGNPALTYLDEGPDPDRYYFCSNGIWYYYEEGNEEDWVEVGSAPNVNGMTPINP